MCEVLCGLTEKHHDRVERILICKSGGEGLDVRVQTLNTLCLVMSSFSILEPHCPYLSFCLPQLHSQPMSIEWRTHQIAGPEWTVEVIYFSYRCNATTHLVSKPCDSSFISS